MKRWLSRVMLAGVVALSGMTGSVVPARAAAPPEASVSDDWEIAVFLCTPSSYGCHKRYATAKQRRDVERFLKSTPEVTEVRFVSRASAYASLRREFAGQKKALASVRARDLPESFRVRVSGAADRARIATSANRRPGVGFAVDQAENQATVLPEEAEIAVFLCMKDTVWRTCRQGRGKANGLVATAKEKKAIVAVIERIPGLESYEYEDQATAYRKFVEAYADNEALVSATRVSDMPESYWLSMRPEADWDAPIRRLARMPGVSQVHDQRCLIQKLRLWSEYGLRRSSCG
ncbi:permease-like cell division protein FtsX [Nonomuraea sediminis]|uniref:permease-like cell division protein FtsX n=1 Tax=Nonomuraea sediminis TaxID=2835864 RepID=UPI001BDDB45C|nr:permease-like cell division protein FtsX [Nonomuraea sediminis]